MAHIWVEDVPVHSNSSPGNDKSWKAVKGYSVENCGVAGCGWTFIYTLAQFVGITRVKTDSAKPIELYQSKLKDVLCLNDPVIETENLRYHRNENIPCYSLLSSEDGWLCPPENSLSWVDHIIC